MGRTGAFLKDLVRICGKAGIHTAFRFGWSRVFTRSETLLYELRTTGREQNVPSGWQITEVRSEEDAAGVGLLRRVGGEEGLRHLRRDAVGYVLSIEGEPVAWSWYFTNNPLSRRLGPNAAYFGATLVRPEWRGRGLQAWLTTYMASRLPAGSKVIMEVSPANVASQHGLAKTASVLVGRLHMIVFLGQLIRARIEVPPPAE